MNVSLTEELENFIDLQVESGMYHSASEVVRDGLRLLIERQESRAERLAGLRRDIAIGLEQSRRGESLPLDIASIKSSGRKRLAALK